MNDAARGAHEARQRIAFGYALFDGGAAVAAELQEMCAGQMLRRVTIR